MTFKKENKIKDRISLSCDEKRQSYDKNYRRRKRNKTKNKREKKKRSDDRKRSRSSSKNKNDQGGVFWDGFQWHTNENINTNTETQMTSSIKDINQVKQL